MMQENEHLTGLYGVTFQEIKILLVTAVKTSNPS
jgi:hypothetical protein